MRRAVLFDLFNTVVPGGDDGARDAVMSRMADILEVDPVALARVFDDTSGARFTGALGDLRETIRTLARRVGGDPTGPQVEAAAAMRCELAARLLAGAPAHAGALLARLRGRGWLLGLVSNTSDESAGAFRASWLAGAFHAAMFSSDLGVRKPDPGIYLATCEALAVEPAACVYVGDGADDELSAAAALGMAAVRTTEHADSDPSWHGVTVPSLSELPVVLGKLR